MAADSEVALHELPAGAATGFEANNSLEQLHSRGRRDGLPAEQSELPTADGGASAWAFLVAAFFIEALIWGKTCEKKAFLIR